MSSLPSVLGLDVGTVRIGVALASLASRLPAPLVTLPNDAQFQASLQQLITEHQVERLVVGWPRNLQGDETAQTKYVADFIHVLESELTIPISTQDEALTSQKAETELKQRGTVYTKGDIDSLSATYILEDYLQST